MHRPSNAARLSPRAVSSTSITRPQSEGILPPSSNTLESRSCHTRPSASPGADGAVGRSGDLLENALRQPHVDAEVRFVDELRDRNVAGNADDLIRLVLRQLLRGGEEVDHLLNRAPGCNR